MNAYLGEYAVLIALVFCIWGLITSAMGGFRRDQRLAEIGRRAAMPVFAFSSLSMIILFTALMQNDTAVRYVANHSSATSPTWVKFVSLWGALEGSILLWAWVLAMYVFIVSRVARNDALRPFALTSLYFVLVFFLSINASVGSPFIPVPVPPEDGRGPNALLQNHWMMAVHPVLMYLGFVGLTVPFAYAIAALFTGRLGETWLAQTRRWTMVAWTFLSAAVISGGWWSYEVLGWGGYWAWDPVENASIIPWFLATAFLHSLQIQERRRILKGWNLGLIIAAFSSTLLGTFLTRSGVVESVHAFAAGPIGPVFLGFLTIVVLGSLGIAYWRLPMIRDDHALDSPVSREGAFLAGNLLFSSFAFTVVLGTLFPVFVDAITGARTSVGAPFFNQVGEPLGLAILLLMAIGPALTWRRVEGQVLADTLRWPVILTVISGVAAFVLGTQVWTVIATVMVSMLSLSVLWTLTARAARLRARESGRKGLLSAVSALGDLLNAYPRRYGAYISHLGVIVIALGISFSGAYKTEQQMTFKFGEARQVQGHSVRYEGLVGTQEAQREVVAAKLVLDGRDFFPRLNYYGNQREPVATPGIQYNFLGDFYTVLVQFEPSDQSAVINFINSPLVSWIWAGGLILVIGAGLTLIPAVVTETRVSRKSVSSPAASD
jgi:cytochrome c-type biogenesis protein CcmF